MCKLFADEQQKLLQWQSEPCHWALDDVAVGVVVVLHPHGQVIVLVQGWELLSILEVFEALQTCAFIGALLCQQCITKCKRPNCQTY